MLFTPVDLQPFFIEYYRNGDAEVIEVLPCCKQDLVHYYDISINKQYQFTVTPSETDEGTIEWNISFKNADKEFDPSLIEFVGDEIEKHYLEEQK